MRRDEGVELALWLVAVAGVAAIYAAGGVNTHPGTVGGAMVFLATASAMGLRGYRNRAQDVAQGTYINFSALAWRQRWVYACLVCLLMAVAALEKPTAAGVISGALGTLYLCANILALCAMMYPMTDRGSWRNVIFVGIMFGFIARDWFPQTLVMVYFPLLVFASAPLCRGIERVWAAGAARWG